MRIIGEGHDFIYRFPLVHQKNRGLSPIYSGNSLRLYIMVIRNTDCRMFELINIEGMFFLSHL